MKDYTFPCNGRIEARPSVWDIYTIRVKVYLATTNRVNEDISSLLTGCESLCSTELSVTNQKHANLIDIIVFGLCISVRSDATLFLYHEPLENAKSAIMVCGGVAISI